MNKKITFCEECRSDVTYNIKPIIIKNSLKGKSYQFKGEKAICDECNNEVYVAFIEDMNLKKLYDAYRKENSIISVEKIIEIPKKYNIGKRPLSIMLGWGELTLTRYINGYIPSKQYSDILQQIYDKPTYYKSILEENKNNINTIAYTKSLKATEELMFFLNQPKNKISQIASYVIEQCEDITHLSLQKSLYYIQGFYYAFKDVFIFNDDCEAWVHGPVYIEIYHQYKSYCFDPISSEKIEDYIILLDDEKEVVDSVIKNINCYSGKVLEHFTHEEEPWKKTRGDIPETMSTDRIIEKKFIGDYFKKVIVNYNIINPSDIGNYSKKMFEQIYNC